MEARNITVVSTRDQKRSVVSTDATTLSELKMALRSAGVDYEGMTFYEGLTHTELLTDEAILPHDVPYKGSVTNELVFMLTNPNKKIRSGALSEARAALFSTILEKHLEAACVEKYGKNFTNCSNADLLTLVEESEPVSSGNCDMCAKAAAAIRKLVEFLYEDDYFNGYEHDTIIGILDSNASEVESSYSQDEIDEMFSFINQ